MRTTYLVCYDVANDKRLRKVFKTCGNFGDHLQFSVFECDLNPSEKIELETALGDIINHSPTIFLAKIDGICQHRWLVTYQQVIRLQNLKPMNVASRQLGSCFLPSAVIPLAH